MAQIFNRAFQLVARRDEAREIALRVLAEHGCLLADTAVIRSISTILASCCRAQEDRSELEADLRYLRRWRKTVEQVKGLTFKAATTVIVTSFLGAVWMAVRAALGK
jgi:hypothetical protein